MNFGEWKRKMSWEFIHPARQFMHMMFTTRWFLGHFWVFCVWIPVLEDVKFARKVMIYKIQNHVETWSFAFVWGEGPDLWDVSVWQTDTRSGKSILARTDLVQKKNGQTRKPWKITPRKVCAFLGWDLERRKTAGIKDLEAKGVSATRRECVIYCGAKTFWDQQHFSGDYRRLRQPQHSVFQNQGPKTPRNRQFE